MIFGGEFYFIFFGLFADMSNKDVIFSSSLPTHFEEKSVISFWSTDSQGKVVCSPDPM